MRVLITGGNGFIGSHLAESMLSRGHSVVLMDLKFGQNTAELSCDKIVGDVSDINSFKRVPTDFDLIFHAAAVSRVEWGELDPEKCLKTNVLGTMNTVTWVAGQVHPPQLVFASSREVYGDPTVFPVTEQHPRNPVSIYGVSKTTAEDLIKHWASSKALKYTIVRLTNVFGSTRDLPERAIPNFVHKAIRNEPLVINGGEQVIDFIYYEDVINDLIQLFEFVQAKNAKCTNTVFNLATGEGHSIRQLAELVRKLTNSSSTLTIVPRRDYDVRKFIGDSSKAQEALHIRPRTDLEKGLEKYIMQVRRS